MIIVYVVLFALLVVIQYILFLLTSKHTFLQEAISSPESVTFEGVLSRMGASGADLIDYLRGVVPHAPFDISRSIKQGSGHFLVLSRKMIIGPYLDLSTPESIFVAAFEFAHVLQVKGVWTLCAILQRIFLVMLIATLIVGLFPGTSLWVLASLMIVNLVLMIAEIPRKIDAIISALPLAKRYLTHKGLNQKQISKFMGMGESFIRAGAIWNIFDVIETVVFFDMSAVLITGLEQVFLAHIIARL